MHSAQSDSFRDADSNIQTDNNTNIHFQSHNNLIAQNLIGIHFVKINNLDGVYFKYIYILLDDSVNNPGSDVERDTTRVTILPPARIFLPTDCPVVQISCGLHHTGTF